MAVPKRKTSKMKSRRRKASHRHPLTSAAPCAECGAPTIPHRVCASCGTYRGRQVLTISADD